MAEKRTRKTKAQIQNDERIRSEMADQRQRMVKQAERAIAQRSKDREFHGLAREFHYAQSSLTTRYDETKDLKHPRDSGTSREMILRSFLRDRGFLPARYAVSDKSVRVASPTGHLSPEVDIALFDPFDSIQLMKREDVYEVLPVESVYGVIQVKSKLTAKELLKGLENLAAFKRLDRLQSPAQHSVSGRRLASRGFGILFAFEAALPWLDVVKTVEGFVANNPSHTWPNGVFILNQGMIFLGDEKQLAFDNDSLSALKDVRVHGRPDQGDMLYSFQSILLDLLRFTAIYPARLEQYHTLPLVAGERSYAFSMGSFAELAACDEHGDYQRKISPDNLERLVDWCRAATPISWIKAIDMAEGRAGDNEAAYERQPGDVRIYNPEAKPLSEILVRETELGGRKFKALAFDTVQTAGISIMIPSYYTEKEGIITGCPACIKKPTRRKQPGK